MNHLIDTAVKSKLLLEGEVSPALRSMVIQALLDGAEATPSPLQHQFNRLPSHQYGLYLQQQQIYRLVDSYSLEQVCS